MDYSVLNQFSDAFIIVDLKTHDIEYLNTQAKILLKVSTDCTIKGTFLFKNEKSWKEFLITTTELLSADVSSFIHNYSLHTYDGENFTTTIKFSYVDNSKKTICFIFCDIDSFPRNDISFCNLAESTSSGVAIITIDELSTIKYANDVFCKIFEIDCNDFKNMDNLFKTIHPDDGRIAVYEYEKQLQDRNNLLIEFRILTQSNKIKWICFEGSFLKNSLGADELYCTVHEISEKKKLLKQLLLEQQFYDIIKDNNDILFRFTFETGKIEYSGEALKNFDLPYIIKNFPADVLEKNVVFAEDIPKLLEMVNNVHKGISKATEFRMINIADQIEWYRVEYHVAFNNDIPFQVGGKIINVNEKKTLEKLATTDALTNCLNKKNIEMVVSKILVGSTYSEKHAFLIIDIDNFKNVNDSLGHHFGDLVLAEISKNLIASFRDSDYVGRIGGDEFVVFLQNIPDLDVIIKKAEFISEIFDNVYFKDDNHYKISGSIGISCFPEDGRTYESLYKKADIALYNSKDRGKNCYSIYNQNFSKGTMENRTPLESAEKLLNENYYDTMIGIIFDLLYGSNDMNESINIILVLLGSQLGVDRCCIFETDDDGEHFNNTFEWCKTDIMSEMDSFQGIPKEACKNVFSQVDRNGIFYSNDLSFIAGVESFGMMHQESIKSFLQFIAKKHDTVNLVVRVDDCTRKRIWSGKDISTLIYVSKILAIFLLGEKNLRKVTAIYNLRTEILDSMQTLVYVIDNSTHKLLYINKKARDLMTSMKIGDFCYSSVRGESNICLDCPIQHLNENCKHYTCELFNSIYNISVLTTVASIKWDHNIDATIVYSVDITKYKKSNSVD